MADVFLSYASTDRQRVRPIIELLQRNGWSVWWDRDIAAGDGFEETIDREIQDARCVIVAWSEEAVVSRWVRNEALEGLERNLLIPVMLDHVRVPVAFRQSQAIDLTRGPPVPDPDSAAALLAAVARLAATGSTLPESIAPGPQPDRPSIAVLPFRAQHLDTDEAFLIDSLTEDLTARLAQVPGFFVIASGTTLGFAGRVVDPVDIGRQLRVRYVVDGSLRRIGERIRVNVQLTDTSTGNQLYSERIETTTRDLSALEDELVGSLISCIEPELMRAELQRISRQAPERLDAWALCRAGLGVLQIRGWHEDVLQEATSLLDRAIDADPHFALPWAAKAVMLGVGSRLGFFDRTESQLRQVSLQAAERGIEMANGDSQVLGYAGCALADWGEVERSMPVLDQAIRRNPSNAQAWVARALALRDVGDLERAIHEARTGLTLSPRDSSVAAWLIAFAQMLMQDGQLQEAGEALREARRRDPRLFAAPLLLAALNAFTGDRDAAVRSMAEALRLRPELTRSELRRLGGRVLLKVLDESGTIADLPED
jgi:adenylate cyclase